MKTVLITGANRGLGRALAVEFSKAKCNMILHCRQDAPKLTLSFPSAFVIQGDLRAPQVIIDLVNISHKKGLDILINNAGVYLDLPFPDIFDEELRELMEVNLIAPMLLTKALWSALKRKREGQIININSLASYQGGAGESVYAASKAGITGFSKTVQADATRDGIRVTNIHLGALKTDMCVSRVDYAHLIDPDEAAKIIFQICNDYRSLWTSSFEIKRRIY